MKLIIDTTGIAATNFNFTHHTECDNKRLFPREVYQNVVETISAYTADIKETTVVSEILRLLRNVEEPERGTYFRTEQVITVHESDEVFKFTIVMTENSSTVYVQSTTTNSAEWPYSALGFEGTRGRFKEIFNATEVGCGKLMSTDVVEYISNGPDNMNWWETRVDYVSRAGGCGVNYVLRDLFAEQVVADIADIPTTYTHQHFIEKLAVEDAIEFNRLSHEIAVFIDRISTVNRRPENKPPHKL